MSLRQSKAFEASPFMVKARQETLFVTVTFAGTDARRASRSNMCLPPSHELLDSLALNILDIGCYLGCWLFESGHRYAPWNSRPVDVEVLSPESCWSTVMLCTRYEKSSSSSSRSRSTRSSSSSTTVRMPFCCRQRAMSCSRLRCEA